MRTTVAATLFAGCPCDANPNNQLLASAIQAAAQAGIVTVVATGNDSQCAQMASPACVSGAIGVVSVREMPTPDRISATRFDSGPATRADGGKATRWTSRRRTRPITAPARLVFRD